MAPFESYEPKDQPTTARSEDSSPFSELFDSDCRRSIDVKSASASQDRLGNLTQTTQMLPRCELVDECAQIAENKTLLDETVERYELPGYTAVRRTFDPPAIQNTEFGRLGNISRLIILPRLNDFGHAFWLYNDGSVIHDLISPNGMISFSVRITPAGELTVPAPIVGLTTFFIGQRQARRRIGEIQDLMSCELRNLPSLGDFRPPQQMISD